MPPSLPHACLLILLDGLADRAHPDLDGLTPLQKAQTPNLDRLARAGSCGHFHALAPGWPLSSEAAHFFMMGCSQEEFPGRGYLEALGYALEFEQEEVLLLAHLASCQAEGRELRLLARKPNLPQDEAAAFMAAVAEYGAAK